MATNARRPTGLAAPAIRLWVDVTKHYDLRHDEVRLLEQACRVLTALTKLDAIVAREGLMSTGSMGQVVVHPAVVEARLQRALLKSHLKDLGLPDLDTGAAADNAGGRSAAARKAATSRWAVAHGA